MTFGELRQTRASDVVGVCSNKETFRALTNEATSRLMTRGNFWATVTKLRTCVRCRAIVWPRAVDTVLATNICGTPVANSGYWYQFLPMNGADFGSLRGWGTFGAGGIGRGSCGNVVILHDGPVPVQAQLTCGNPRYIRAFASYQADLGKHIIIFGIDDNGQVIMTKRDDGTWQPGVQLTLAFGERAFENLERAAVVAALQRADGNQTRAARLLGIQRLALSRAAMRLGITTGRVRARS